MKNVHETLKNEIKNQVETIRGIREKITELKWTPQGREKAVEIKAERRKSPRPLVGKAELKPFRRPETGPERAALWADKREESEQARYLMLAYGAIRGRTYRQIEVKCREGNEPSVYRLARLFEDRESGEPLYGLTEKAIEAWLKGTPLPLPERPQQRSVVAVAMEASL